MILAFKPQFIEPINNGSKIHSIRQDWKNRWVVGRIIHGATGVRTKNYNQFFEATCVSIQKFEVEWALGEATVLIDNKVINNQQLITLAKNDGFESVVDFLNWFNDDFVGKIIHWTKFKY